MELSPKLAADAMAHLDYSTGELQRTAQLFSVLSEWMGLSPMTADMQNVIGNQIQMIVERVDLNRSLMVSCDYEFIEEKKQRDAEGDSDEQTVDGD
jgi:hypothetical protein